MIPKIWLINLLLAMMVIYFGVNAYQVWEGGVEPAGTAMVATPGEDPGPAGRSERFAKRVMPAESAYDIIAAPHATGILGNLAAHIGNIRQEPRHLDLLRRVDA